MALPKIITRKPKASLADTLALKAADRQVDSDLESKASEDYYIQASAAYNDLIRLARNAEDRANDASRESAALLKAKAILDEAGVTL